MDAKQLIEQMRAQRKRWVDVAEGKRVQILLPTDMEVSRHFVRMVEGRASVTTDMDAIKRFVIGWDGFTESDLLGASVGASDPAPFDADLWEMLFSDRLDWFQAVAAALITGINERHAAREADAKN